MEGDVLSDVQIEELIKQGHILGADPKLVNPASLDLTIGMKKWRLTGSILPLANQSVCECLTKTSVVDDFDDSVKTFFLDSTNPYLFEIIEKLNLPEGISARVFNKSGRGRIGTSVRTICDGVSEFDHVPAGYKGKLFSEVRPTTFPEIVVCGETTMPQIRFYRGNPKPLIGNSLALYLEKEPILVDQNDNPIQYSTRDFDRICQSGRFTFTADLSRELLAYRAKKDGRTLDLSKKNYYNPEDFFEAVKVNGKPGILLHPGDFVLIHSREKIRLPPTLAAEIAEYSSEIGDFKSHYAGLINPGHGYDPEKITGANIVFEVRARDTPIYLQDGQALAQFQVYKMESLPKRKYMEIKSTSYEDLPSILPVMFKKNGSSDKE